MESIEQINAFCRAAQLDRAPSWNVKRRAGPIQIAQFIVAEDSEVFPGEVWWSPFVGMTFLGVMVFEEGEFTAIRPVRLTKTTYIQGRSIPNKYILLK